MTILATEVVSTVGGREGKSSSKDGKIDFEISPPGTNGPGTNPEQLFAAGYSACFGGAILAAAGLAQIALRSRDIKVTATVNLNKGDSGYYLTATINGEAQGVEQAKLVELVKKAHTLCPYSKAITGNVEVELQANGSPV